MRNVMAIIGAAFITFNEPVVADSIVDGDTHYVDRLKCRLCGIDGQERNEPGYVANEDETFR